MRLKGTMIFKLKLDRWLEWEKRRQDITHKNTPQTRSKMGRVCVLNWKMDLVVLKGLPNSFHQLKKKKHPQGFGQLMTICLR